MMNKPLFLRLVKLIGMISRSTKKHMNERIKMCGREYVIECGSGAVEDGIATFTSC